MPGWILAIDFGTSSTAAARRVGDRVELIQLEGGPRMPSMVFWREGTGAATGRLVLGQEADELSTLAPWCLERSPKRRLGDESMQLGEKQLRVVEVVGAILREVHNEALSLSGGEPPGEIRLTHPARWGRGRLDKLREAARIAGIEHPDFVPEPVAAAVHFASERLSVGEHVAVYDLGGGTFDTAVLRRTEASFEVVGRPGGDEELGGEDFDDLLYRHLGDQLAGETWRRMRSSDGREERAFAGANRDLLRHARRAKEALSRNPQYEFYMGPPVDQELLATAPDFERLVAPTLRGTAAELENTIIRAGLKPDQLRAIYLAGGSSRIPLVARLIHERLGLMPEHLDDPKAVIALGAARLTEAGPKPSPGPVPVPATIPDTTPEPVAVPTVPAGSERVLDETEVDPGIQPREEAKAEATPPAPPRGPEAGDGDGGRKPPPDGADTRARRRRRAIIAGIGAVVVAGGVAAGVVVAVAGGGGGSSSSTTTTTTSAQELKENQLAQSIDKKYRDSCDTEKKNLRTEGSDAGLSCRVPPADATYIESFPNRATANQVFKQWAVYEHGGQLPRGGPCKAKPGGWELQTTWTKKGVTSGRFACTFSKGETEVVWSDFDDQSIGWVYKNGKTVGDGQDALQAWSNAVYGP